MDVPAPRSEDAAFRVDQPLLHHRGYPGHEEQGVLLHVRQQHATPALFSSFLRFWRQTQRMQCGMGVGFT